MEGKNYLELGKSFFFKDAYLYIDTDERRAFQLFARRRVPVQVKAEFGKEGEKYHLVACKVSRKFREEFVSCMEELSRNMLLLGHPDYPEACGHIMGMFAENGN